MIGAGNNMTMMENVTVRYLNENDIKQVQSLIDAEPDMKLYIDFDCNDIDDTGFYVGMFCYNDLIGVCTIGSAVCEKEEMYREEDCIISNLYIVKAERNKGYGTHFVKETLMLANEQYGDATVHISLLDSKLADWYKKNGFEPTKSDEFGICSMTKDLFGRKCKKSTQKERNVG